MITLAEIKTQCRQRADMEQSQFITDSELTTYINASIAELHDLLIGAYNEDYSMENVEFATSTGVVSYALPDGTNYSAAPRFYKLRGVDVKYGNDQYATVKRFNFNRRNEDQNSFVWNLLGVPYLEYRLVGSNVRFNRVPDSSTTIRLWYHPSATVLVADSDSYDDVNGWIEYVVTDVAIKMLNKEESDVTVLAMQKSALKQRIEDMAQNRDANEPESVSDIYAEAGDAFYVGRR